MANVDLRPARLTLVERQNSERAGWRGEQRVLGPVGPFKLGRIQEDLASRLALGGGEGMGSTSA